MIERRGPSAPEGATSATLDAARGALLGLVVGEATGKDAATRGPWVEMALSLAQSLVDRGRFVATDVTRRYVAQASAQTSTDDVTIASLAMIARGVSIGEASCRAFVHAGMPELGDGALARIAPLGIRLSDKPLPRRLAALAECAITHYEPRCRIASSAFCAAIAKACEGDNRPASMLEAARAELDEASSALKDLVPRDGPLADVARRALHASLLPNERANEPTPGVFPLLFEALMRAGSWEEGLSWLSRSPSHDEAGFAALGALLGARFGAGGIAETSLRRAFGDAVEDQTQTLYALADGLMSRRG